MHGRLGLQTDATLFVLEQAFASFRFPSMELVAPFMGVHRLSCEDTLKPAGALEGAHRTALATSFEQPHLCFCK